VTGLTIEPTLFIFRKTTPTMTDQLLLDEDEPEVAEVRIPMSKETFLRWNPENEFQYEYDNGFAEQTMGMKNIEYYLVANLEDAFYQTQAFREKGKLLQETDVWLTANQMRRPDLAFFTQAQIRAAANGGNPVPVFVVEIISDHDKARKVEHKVREYFTAGVQVVWHIYPDDELKMVRIFLSPRQQNTHFDTDALTAAPALPDLQLTVDQLFTI
jgi:Uma2 family endonuclease